MNPYLPSFLQASQNRDGGWGHIQGQASVTEATAAVILALHKQESSLDALSRGLVWLRQAQHRDGGWGMSLADRESGWQTAWALWALVEAGVAGDTVQRGREWLLEVEIPEVGADDLQRIRQIGEIDPTLRGWPWWPGEATWVEPTALAMIALAGGGSQEPVTQRLGEGVAFLHDRRCQSGGWNVGNPAMFSQPLQPRAHPTALALLALNLVAPDRILPEDVQALRVQMDADGGTLALAIGLFALRRLGAGGQAGSAARLDALRAPDGSWNANPYHTALATLASESRS